MPIVPVLAVHAAQRSRDGLRLRRQNIGLPHGIDWLQLFAILIMPEGPAVARRRVLQGCTQLVDRSGVPFRLQRSIHANCCLPTPLGIEKDGAGFHVRSEEHTSELQSLMRISYAVFCLKKKQN